MTARKGFSLIELMVAIMMLTVGLLGLAATTAVSTQMIGAGGRHTLAASVAQSRFETMQRGPCAALTAGSSYTRGHDRIMAGRFSAHLRLSHGARDLPDASWFAYAGLPHGAPMLSTPMSFRRRDGASIIELMIALVIFGLVMAGVTSAIVEQTRFQAGAARVVGSQRSMRHIGDLLPSELRALGTGAGDIYAMGPSSIDLRVTTGSSVVCSISGRRTSVTIPPVQLATAVPLTAWRDVPLGGDSVFIFDEGASTARNDDTWRAYRLTAAATAAGTCATATGFTRSAGEAAAGRTVSVTPAIPITTVPGAPMRFFRPARYGLRVREWRALVRGIYRMHARVRHTRRCRRAGTIAGWSGCSLHVPRFTRRRDGRAFAGRLR